ncbi:MAG TPA: hypothetical protein VGB24_14245 [Longimicrobium sp.]|uniref:hypothetical protein n=1 Tax=Longimicrobium sp. TaxID=2029185 RepID=UPI002ED8F2BE
MNTAAYPAPYAAAGRAAARRPARPFPWVPAFIVFQLACQLMLISGLAGVRVLVRMAAFGASLALLALLRGRGSAHPARGPAILVFAILGVCVFHPETSSPLAGVAQVALYGAVLAPLFWAPRLTSIDIRMLRQTVMVLWAFHTFSAAIGVVQVYRPGTLQPPLSTVVQAKGKGYVESLKITTATGQRVFRPMGLTDVPGGAAVSGLYAVLLGVGFFLTRRTPLALGVSLASIVLGAACLYLSQVRSLAVMTGISLLAVAAVLMWRKDVKRLSMLGVGVFGMLLLGYAMAVNMAGAAVTNRVASLVQARPTQVYYDNRGRFLEDALTKTLPAAPLGEGLGHWGMTATYFGGSSPGKNIWVEIQWAGWIVDGGAPLLFTYLLAVGVCLLASWRIARAPPPGPEAQDLPFWAAIVMAYSVGALALTFSYPIFVSQSGMEFWLLNATLFAAARHAHQASLAAAAAG